MKCAIYHKDFIPEPMLAKHGKPAFYIGGLLALFCETLEDITGTPAEKILDVAAMGFNPTNDPEQTGLTPEQLTGMIDATLNSNTDFDDTEWQLSNHRGGQAYWLKMNNPRFRAEEEEL